MKDFSAQLNEDFYLKSLKFVETLIAEIGEKAFQERLGKLFRQFPHQFVTDDQVEKILRDQ
jgi:DNA replication initiation complex subunit (GINS family)